MKKEKNKSFKYKISYIEQFKNWKICQETKLLNEKVIIHLNNLKQITDKIILNQKI